ncbi:phage tail terminator-like protein [Salipiger marinus]|uniref:phage tail terminator-like protein n=1 Tax=Salipiger marinus TaxID=555512 RepID=UPI002B87F6A8|nr:phage tail terminator-like protein [Salipiger manganoxidans]MEB3419904.1 phage tail terminator-like protein [Salipiger manganoxidans]
MTYQLERAAIEAYFRAQWGSTTPIGFDGHTFTPVNNSVRLTITSGATRQGSIGRTANRIDHLGLATLQIITEGGKGSAAWRGYAETIMGLFFEKTLTSTGAVITSGADAFVRFSPPELGENRHPYIAADFPDPPFHLTNVIAPFVRYAFR